MTVKTLSVTFKHAGLDVAAVLRVPSAYEDGARGPALVLATPGSSVKEQIGANYAGRLAERGFVTLTFDPLYQGQSGGEPRDLEDPGARIEDIRCAVDYLMTLASVDEHRVGLLGICAGAGYAISAAMTEYRFKAVATVVPVNIGRARRQGGTDPAAVRTLLEAVGRQRTLEARGGPARRDPWIPDTPQAAHDAGILDPDLLEAVDFYRTPRGFNEHSTNRIHFSSFGRLVGYDAFHMVSELLIQPLQVVVGGRLGQTFSFSDGKTLYERAPNRKGFHVVKGAGHYEMYDKSPYIDEAVDVLAQFYGRWLEPREPAPAA